jgi:hypothetical protein
MNQNNLEQFIVTHYPSFYPSFYPSLYQRYCSDCGDLDPIECDNCMTCGTCYTPNGYKECVTGDEYGPFFRSDCIDYQYNRLPTILLHPMIDPYYFWPFNYTSNRSNCTTCGSSDNISKPNKEIIHNDAKRDLRTSDKIKPIKLDNLSNHTGKKVIGLHNTSKFSRSSDSNRTDGIGFKGRHSKK